MKAENKHQQKFTMLQPKKTKGGVGAKKQSVCRTPIRLSAVSRNHPNDYTGSNCTKESSYSNQTHSKIAQSIGQPLCIPKPEHIISRIGDQSTPINRHKQFSK